MLSGINETGRNYRLAREIYRETVRYNGRLLREEEIPRQCDFQLLDKQFGDRELILRHYNPHWDPGHSHVHRRKEERVIALTRAYPIMSLHRIILVG